MIFYSWRQPNECLTTAWRMLDECLTTAWRQSDYCRWLPDNCVTTAWRLPDEYYQNPSGTVKVFEGGQLHEIFSTLATGKGTFYSENGGEMWNRKIYRVSHLYVDNFGLNFENWKIIYRISANSFRPWIVSSLE